MKKILLLLSLAMISLCAISQNPVTKLPGFPSYTFGSNETTLNENKGAFKAKKGLINGIYTDTTEANLGFIDAYAGAEIFTTSDTSIWYRNSTATKWIRTAASVSTFNYASDSTLIICYGNGVCDTIRVLNFNTVINNIVQNFLDSSVIYNQTDSFLVVCRDSAFIRVCDTIHLGTTNTYYFITIGDTLAVVTCDTVQVITVGDSSYQQQLCDTILIPGQTPIPGTFSQNWLRKIPGTQITEFGSADPGDLTPQMLHDTWSWTNGYQWNIYGRALGRPITTVTQTQWSLVSSSITQFNHQGNYDGFNPSAIDNFNPVNLYINYIDPIIPGNGVFAGDTIGFAYKDIGYALMTNSQGERASYLLNSAISKQTGIMLHTLDTANTSAVTIFGNQAPNAYAFSVSPFPTTTLHDSRIAVFKTTGQQQNPKYGVGTFLGTPTYSIGVDALGNLIEFAAVSGSVTSNNGLTMSTPTNVQLGGTLIQNTTLLGAYPLVMSDNNAKFGLGLSAATLAGYQQSLAVIKTFPPDAYASGAGYINANYAPTGLVFTDGLNSLSNTTLVDLSAGYYTPSGPFADISGIVGSAYIKNSNGVNQTTAFVSGVLGAVLLDNDVMLSDVAAIKAKQIAVSGTGHAVDNVYGVYISDMNTFAGIVNSYGVFQIGTSDLNYFGGQVKLDNVNSGLVTDKILVRSAADNIVKEIDASLIGGGGGGGTPANPTAQVGLSAVNGVASTYMRSDAAPALNQGITPTWTGAHNFNNSVVIANGAGSGTSGNSTYASYTTSLIQLLHSNSTNGGRSLIGMPNNTATLYSEALTSIADSVYQSGIQSSAGRTNSSVQIYSDFTGDDYSTFYRQKINMDPFTIAFTKGNKNDNILIDIPYLPFKSSLDAGDSLLLTDISTGRIHKISVDDLGISGGGYTDEMAQDAVGAMINASLQYVDGTPLLAIGDRDYGPITVTGSGLTWTIDAGAVTNAMLANSTISGISLGSNLADLTIGTNLQLSSGTTYNGGTAKTISLQNAAADGSTKGAASFTAADFDASSGNISIDYTNGQAASGSLKGFLTSGDWTTFNSKQAAFTSSEETFTGADLTTYDGTTGFILTVANTPISTKNRDVFVNTVLVNSYITSISGSIFTVASLPYTISTSDIILIKYNY